ncbi:hypothetical protein QJS10_CPA03g01253 [Acorus calamus]|uniref:SANT domain-containing protein n=1 Tax=Acorus calamus TaxID=4465 RepID=A0AAV9F580_ACOCL|nr:hypothetical protein QJS10_CPA03g01253 [Acorus calamus]
MKRMKRKSKSMIDLNKVPKKRSVTVHWTVEEHRRFLEGLQALGRGKWAGIARDYVITRNVTQVSTHAQKRAAGIGQGEWAGIARDYVITRNATQVASHAQKHFLYQLKNAGKQHKGSSIFDLHLPPPPPPPQPAPQRLMNNVDNPTPVLSSA